MRFAPIDICFVEHRLSLRGGAFLSPLQCLRTPSDFPSTLATLFDFARDMYRIVNRRQGCALPVAANVACTSKVSM